MWKAETLSLSTLMTLVPMQRFSTRFLLAVVTAQVVKLPMQGPARAVTLASTAQAQQAQPDTSRRKPPLIAPGLRSVDSVLVLGAVRLRLTLGDSTAAHELWLGHEYERVGRITDAVRAYERARQQPGAVRSYASERLRVLLREQRASQLPWLPSGVREAALWLRGWSFTVNALWGLAVLVFLVWAITRSRRAKNAVQVEQFTRRIPEDFGVGLEDTIVDVHRRSVEVSRPLGVIINSGLKLHVLATSSQAIIDLVEVVSPKPWITKLVGLMLRWRGPDSELAVTWKGRRRPFALLYLCRREAVEFRSGT